MRNKNWSEEIFLITWERLAANPYPEEVRAVHYFLVPIFGLLCYLPNSNEKNLGVAFLHFLFFYLPYLISMWIVYKVTERDLRIQHGKKFEKAVIIAWLSNGIGWLVFSALMQSGAILTLIHEFNYTLREKAIAVICFLGIDISIFVLSTFGKRIINLLNSIEQRSNETISARFIFQIGILLLIFVFAVGYVFSGFQDLGDYFEFVLGSLGSFLVLLGIFLPYTQFVRVFIWRKRNFWNDKLDE